jgi:6-phosphogluconate dehydrogenase
MQLGMIGLGKMGANMTERLVNGGHRVVGFDLSPESVQGVVDIGAEGANSIEELVSSLTSPRHIWIMVPQGKPVDATIEALLPLLGEGDVLIDGGNSNFKDTIRRADACREAGGSFVDVGTSGGVWGLAEGYSMMIGGDVDVVENMRPIFETLAPAPDKGWGRTGASGAGHYVKMIHNGIEYGLMQAYAEGFDIMRSASAETVPEAIRYDLDLPEISELWRRGSVVGSWLLDLTAQAFVEQPDLEDYSGHVTDSGEGRWTVNAAVEQAVPAEVLTAALYTRFRSRQNHTFAEKVLSAMRHKFGGHVETK